MDKKIAKLYNAAVEDCKWLTPQFVASNVLHSYWAFTLKLDTDNYNVSWKSFRECFMKNGGKNG